MLWIQVLLSNVNHCQNFNMVQLPYQFCFASTPLDFRHLALQGSKGGISPDQTDRMLALILHGDLLAEAMT